MIINNNNTTNNMKKIFFALTLSMYALYGNSQTLPSQCTAFRPAIVNGRTIYRDNLKNLESSNYGQNSATTDKRHWDVYSDRCNNIAYKDADKTSGEAGRLKFNQEVRIAEIKNGFALVYTEKRKNLSWPSISSSTTCHGWVPMENLLLWTSCPTNEYGIYRKALIVRNLDQKRDKSFGKISEHPDINDESHVSPLKSSINFHYIMKEVGEGDNTRYLIARYNTISDGTITDQVLEGWVSRNSFSAWNQRSCLEPNWDEDDVNFFTDKGDKAWLYEDANFISKTQAWTFGQKNSENQEETQYRMPPRAMRFPILDNDTKKDDNFKITAFGAANGELGRQMVTMDASREATEKALQQTNHINVIVVIDGTRSMGKYFNVMSNAVKQATQYLEGEVSVGVVIYRDYTDGEENVIEYHKMAKPNDASLHNFLTNIGRNNYGASSSGADKTAHEALYLGLKTALNHSLMGYSPKNSNLVFIVGDCGNDPNDKKISQNELLEMCKESEVQLFSFQVLNLEKPAWENFNTQLTDLFVKHMRNMYSTEKSVGSVTWKPVKHGLGVRPTDKDKKRLYVSEMHRGQTGVELSEGELTDLIRDSYITFKTAIEEQKVIIERFGAGVMATDSTEATGEKGTSITEEFLKRRLGKDYNDVKNANALLAYNGYARKNDGLEHDYWQAVVFLSKTELEELVAKLNPLAIAARTNTYSTEDRNNYVNAITGIIQSMTERSAEEIAKLDENEITRIIGGLNVSTPMLKGKQGSKTYTLSEIKSPKACPDEDFKRIVHRMSTKIDNLSKLPKAKDFKYSFEQNGVRSYWVPLEYIP